jgi:hypothetical protein
MRPFERLRARAFLPPPDAPPAASRGVERFALAVLVLLSAICCEILASAIWRIVR